MSWMHKHIRHLLAAALVIVVGITVMWPLTQAGLFTAHDIWHQVARFYHYHAAISAGFWPPGWIMNLANDFGYPLFYFSYHLPWMFGELLLRSGFSIPTALKILFGGGVVLSGLTMYWYCWTITKKIIPSLVGASIYVIAPYHFLAVYVAAAIGTVYQFVFIPLFFIGIRLIVTEKDKQTGIIIAALGLSGSILSHFMSTIMFLPFLAIWFFIEVLLLQKRTLKKFRSTIISMVMVGILAFALSAFYILPLLSFKSAIIADSAGGFRSLYTSNFVTLRQLLYSPWGFGPIISNAKDGEISMQIGAVQWLGVAGLVTVLILNSLLQLTQIKKIKHLAQIVASKYFPLDIGVIPHKFSIGVILLFVIICAAMLEISAPVWFFVNKYMTLDYPWRLLLMAVFFGSAAMAVLISSLKSKFLVVLAAGLVITLAWYTNRNHIGVNLYTYVPVEDYVQAETTTNTFAEYLPRGARDAIMREELPFVLESTAQATVSAQSPVVVAAEVEVDQDGTYTLHQYAFPTLVVRVDGVPVSTSTGADGLLQLQLTKGNHTIQVAVNQPMIIKVGALLSVVTFAGVLGYILLKRGKRYGKK